MTNLQRLTGKIFGETATATGDDPQIGQFGSALNGTYIGTTDVATIQSLPAWSNGFIDSVTPNEQFPPLPEMTGFGKVLSYQTAYTLQKGVPEWDVGTTYYTGDFAKGIGEGKLYVSKVDDNINNDLSDTTYWEEFVSSGGSRNIGEIVASTIPLTDAGLHLLDGALIDGSGSYQAFVDYIAELVTDYPNLFCTEADWQTSVTNYGVCGKFVYDSTNNTVRLPKVTGILEGTTDVSALGDLVEAGLPNITGTCFQPYGSNGTQIAGAFHNARGAGINSTAGGGGPIGLVDFSASLSSSIYGNSSTVQPQTIKVLYYIVIATSTKTDVQVDIDEIATDLNSKADVDLTNITNTASTKMAHNAMLSNTKVSITIGAVGTQYTAPANGYYWATGTSGYIYLTNESVGVASMVQLSSGVVGHCNILVKKGDVVTLWYQGSTMSTFYFVYAEGSKWEAQ